MTGSWNHTSIFSFLLYAADMLRLIRGTKQKLNQFITHRLPMEKVQEAWELQGQGKCGKIVLHPQSA